MGSKAKHRFTFVPADALVYKHYGHGSGWNYSPGQWLAAWAYYCGRLLDWRPGPAETPPCELLNGTSSIRNSQFAPFTGDVSAECARRLAQLFAGVGARSATFLESLGLRKWSDLARPVVVSESDYDALPRLHWFDAGGRTFRVSPNSCHPDARSVYRGELHLTRRLLWEYRLVYGYPHDASSWTWAVSQSPRESLPSFAERVDAEVEAVLEPDIGLGRREEAASRWHTAHDALRALFWDDHVACGWEDGLAAVLEGVDGGSLACGRIFLTPQRLSTIREWCEDAAAQSCKRKTEEESRRRDKVE